MVEMTSLWSSIVGYLTSVGCTKSHFFLLTYKSTREILEIDEAESIVVEVLDVYEKLKSRQSLKPCDEVDALFGRLVGVCTLNRSSGIESQVLQDPRLLTLRSNLRLLCDKAECCLESHWAEIIIRQQESTSEAVFERLQAFPYFQNYVDLARLELSTINGVRTASNPISKIAFLGSGPLPLTSLCLLNADRAPFSDTRTQMTVLNVDSDLSAILQSQTLCQKLGGRATGMGFLHTSANSSDLDLREFDVVYLAALVGGDQQEKESILAQVTGGMREGSLLVVRSADRLRRVLYPAFDPGSEVVRNHLDILAVVHPYNHVVNSVVIGRVKSDKEMVLKGKV